MNLRNTAMMALALVTSAVLAGCGNAEQHPAEHPAAASAAQSSAAEPNTAEPNAAEPNAGQHNAADVTFAQGMIPHHAQAVEMAELAPERAGSDQVKQLAAAIRAAQQPEIDQLTAMLRRWNAPVPAAGTSTGGTGGDMAGMAGMDHHGAHGDAASGMMSGADMAALGKARGAEFDRQFLTLMVAHHQGAVRMAASELRDGRDAEATALARKITDAQNAEIDQMRGLLAS